MVKHAVAAAVIGLGAASGAWAQSSVTLYGILDAGITYVNNTGGSHVVKFDDGVEDGTDVSIPLSTLRAAHEGWLPNYMKGAG